jgi:RNA polymerase sigma factor (sigma-70 family)
VPKSLLGDLFRFLRRERAAGPDLSDGALLERFLDQRDEAAFEALLQRHGPMVLGVCQRVTGDTHAAEDAFQATFLVLARKAGAIRKQASLASWLFGVAQRVACKARTQAATRREREKRAANMRQTESLDELTWQELRAILDEEIGALPAKFQSAIVLCHLEGKSYDQAAQELGFPKSTLARRLTKALELLRGRLTRRGIALSAAVLATALAERTAAGAVPALVSINIVKAAACVAAGKSLAAGILSTHAIALAEEAMKTMIYSKFKLVLAVSVALGLAVGAAFAGYGAWLTQSQDENPPPLVQPDPQRKDAAGPAVDLDGDPLPDGAVARLGTLRFRHGLNAVAMAYSPDGKWLASLQGSSMQYGLRILEAGTGKVLHRHTFEKSVLLRTNNSAIAFSKDSKWIVTPQSVIDVATGKEVHRLQYDKTKEILRQFQEGVFVDTTYPAWIAAVSPDGRFVARQQWAGSGTGTILTDAATGKELRRLGWDDKEVKRAFFPEANDFVPPRPVFSPNGALLATAKADKVIRLWEVETGNALHGLQGHEQDVNHLAISPDGKVLASTGQGEGLIRLWDVPKGKALREIKIDARNVGIWFAPDGKLLTTKSGDKSGDKTVRLYDCGSGKELRRWQMPCACMAFSPDGKELATAGRQDRIVHRWDMHADKSLDDTSRNHTQAVSSLRFAPDGKTLYSLDIGPIAMEWDLTTMRSRNTTFAGPLGSVKMPDVRASAAASGAQLSPTGKVVAVYNSREGAVYLCDVVTGKDLHILRGENKDLAYFPEFSPDGKIVALGRGDKDRLWDVATGKRVPHPPLPPGFVKAWSADGKLLAILNVPKKGERRIHLCEVATGKEIRSFESQNTVTAIALSSDGKSMAAFSWDITYTKYEIVVFDTETDKRTEFLDMKDASSKAGRSGADEVAFSPSGGYLAVVNRDTIQLWEVRSGQKIRDFHAGHSIITLRFSPDGRTLASGGEDSTILLWDLTRIVRPKAQE